MKLFIISFCSLLGFCLTAWADVNETQYCALLMDNQKIGYTIHIRAVEGTKVTTTEKMSMTIGRGPTAMTIKAVEKCIETLQGKPIAFESVMDITGTSQKTSGRFNDKGKIEITTQAAGVQNSQLIDYPQDAIMAEGIRLLQIKMGLEEGTSYKTSIFSPSLLSVIPAQINVKAKTPIDLFGRVTQLTKVEVILQAPGASITTTSYVDSELRSLKTVMPAMGMIIQMVACDKAFALSENANVVDFIDKLLVKSPVELKDIANKKSITYCLVAKDGKKLEIPAGDNQQIQQVKPSVVNVTVKPLEAAKDEPFPYKGTDPVALEALKPTQYVQSSHKEIADLARHAVTGAQNSAQAVKQIESFVAGYITEKDLSVGYGSALDVARSRQGDCSEHAVLTTAMCRAVGIPARIVCGLVYVDEFMDKKNVFGGHAWAEAFIAGKWIAIDATRAPTGFSPAHIKLTTGNGDPADFFAMTNTLGRFKIEKITTQE